MGWIGRWKVHGVRMLNIAGCNRNAATNEISITYEIALFKKNLYKICSLKEIKADRNSPDFFPFHENDKV